MNCIIPRPTTKEKALPPINHYLYVLSIIGNDLHRLRHDSQSADWIKINETIAAANLLAQTVIDIAVALQTQFDAQDRRISALEATQ